MQNRVKVRRRGKSKYDATETPLQFRSPGEARVEVMATTRQALDEKYEIEIARRRQGLDEAGGKATVAQFLKDKFLDFYKTASSNRGRGLIIGSILRDTLFPYLAASSFP